MKVKLSKFLEEKIPDLEKIVEKLSQKYRYVSILGNDVRGKRYLVTEDIKITDSNWNERGFVVRVYNGLNYSEYSFDEIDDSVVDFVNERVVGELEKFKSVLESPLIEEEKENGTFEGEVEILPEEIDAGKKIKILSSLRDRAYSISNSLANFWAIYEEVNVSKIFLSGQKHLSQSYVWTQGYLQAIARRDEKTKYSYEGYSGMKGAEILYEMEKGVEKVVREAESLIDSTSIEPGEYDVICSPDVSGVIAHEAFGHGVEMDMFVKGRAKAVEYLGREVASKLVTMHDGASAAKQVASYFFDDEGVIGKDTVVIEKGILKSGISDLISSLRLGTRPTGNGRRESFERKAYSRMTNTFFEPGNDSLEEMISSIKDGYLLEKVSSGMEDPKNWGIQCWILYGREIKDGHLTDRIVSPILMTGYVPDLLKSISMVSKDLELSGTGACGKGHKEFVKVSSGGPYIKARARLG
ncbi:TldD/PmbA family protein [Athalassotoga saccharophila]|uniref:TldD/PmbA family protein n=1 Tax=Athalassotoga saccharophila TaxID=1441386 RepID=UPI00137A8425|nr:TldD/PmbA family protein [Athalassotoga saccharophila]BBJ27725.1 metalloprotease TldD [Athalassotoga saccharophila]